MPPKSAKIGSMAAQSGSWYRAGTTRGTCPADWGGVRSHRRQFDCAGNSAAVTIQVSKSDFTIPKAGKVELELVATGDGGAPLSIGAPIAATKLGKVGRESAAGAGWRIASLGPGQFTFPISGGVAGAAFTVDFSLVGDVNGNGVVNRADLKAIRSRLGVSSKSRRFLPGADLIPNKRIGAADLRIALSDLNARTSLKPLSLVVGALQSAGTSPLASVVVQAQAGAPSRCLSEAPRKLSWRTVPARRVSKPAS